LLRGYQAPTTVTSTKTGPLSSAYYQGSPLSQTIGIGTAIGAGLGTTKTTDPRTGVVTEVPNWLSKLWDSSKDLLGKDAPKSTGHWEEQDGLYVWVE
jgi:hypothetical protein